MLLSNASTTLRRDWSEGVRYTLTDTSFVRHIEPKPCRTGRAYSSFRQYSFAMARLIANSEQCTNDSGLATAL